MNYHPKIRRVFSFLSRKHMFMSAAAFFVFLVLICGALYAYLTPSGDGVKEGSVVPENFGFLQGIYFSIVTISSLGYGDLRPVGLSRIIASIEVVLGLSLIGVMIAAFTSRLLSHLVSRLFASDARKHLQEFSSSFNNLEQRFQILLLEMSQAYETTPGMKQKALDTEAISSAFRNSTWDLHTNTTDVYNYIQDESGEGIYFDLVPVPALKKMLDSIYGAFFALNQCFISLPTTSRPEVFLDILNRQNSKYIMRSVELLRATSELGRNNSRNMDIVNSFKDLDKICEVVSNNFFQAPAQQHLEQGMYTSTTPQP